MNKAIQRYFISFIIFSIIGTVQHFLYDLVGYNLILNTFYPINESVIEHMKLIFYPSLIFYIYNYDFKSKNNKATYTASFVVAVTVAIAFCIGSYLIYTKFFPQISEILNISFYYISMFILFTIMYVMNYITNNIEEDLNIICEMIIFAYIFIFWLFTYFPPSKTYGIFKIP